MEATFLISEVFIENQFLIELMRSMDDRISVKEFTSGLECFDSRNQKILATSESSTEVCNEMFLLFDEDLKRVIDYFGNGSLVHNISVYYYTVRLHYLDEFIEKLKDYFANSNRLDKICITHHYKDLIIIN